MKHEKPDDKLEQLLHLHLRELPQPSAPPDLIANVLQQIAARKNRVWWRSPWPEWPRGMQILSTLVLAGFVTALWYFTPEITGKSAQLGAWLTSRLQIVKSLWTVVEALAGAFQVLVSSIKSQYLIIGATIVGLSYLSFIGLGTLFYRIAADDRAHL